MVRKEIRTVIFPYFFDKYGNITQVYFIIGVVKFLYVTF